MVLSRALAKNDKQSKMSQICMNKLTFSVLCLSRFFNKDKMH